MPEFIGSGAIESSILSVTVDALDKSPLWALFYAGSIYLAVSAFAHVLANAMGKVPGVIQKAGERYGCIDGLRGILATGVFIHHSSATHVYLTSGVWSWSDSPVMNQLAQTAVALFFMITAFLFSSRLLSVKPVDWKSLFISRLARLVPLHTLFVFATLFSVLYFSAWEIREPVSRLLTESISWMAFGMWGRPDINGVQKTWTMVAGVNWTLRIEWAFYAALPVLYTGLNWLKKGALETAAAVSFLTLLVAGSFLDIQPPLLLVFMLHFALGTTVALLLKRQAFRNVIASTPFQIVASLCLILLFTFRSAHAILPVLLTGIVFCAVVGGWSMMGVLTSKGVLWLGEISYGYYLLHGLVLYWSIVHLQQFVDLEQVSLVPYLGFICLLGCGVTLLATITYQTVEVPWIKKGKRIISNRVRRVPIPREKSENGAEVCDRFTGRGAICEHVPQ